MTWVQNVSPSSTGIQERESKYFQTAPRKRCTPCYSLRAGHMHTPDPVTVAGALHGFVELILPTHRHSGYLSQPIIFLHLLVCDRFLIATSRVALPETQGSGVLVLCTEPHAMALRSPLCTSSG